MKKTITVNDSFQHNYHYILTKPIGKEFDARFRPQLTPAQMLALGIFGGKYINDSQEEFPKSWYKKAKLSTGKASSEYNYFKVNASQPLSVWQAKGWIHPQDPRGWFQWYCRYYMGRRTPQEDERQIKRWAAITRHVSQLQKACLPGDLNCRPRQRQALLHWAYDSRKL